MRILGRPGRSRVRLVAIGGLIVLGGVLVGAGVAALRSQTPIHFPSEAAGRPVVSVEAAVQIRDGIDGRLLAVAGWYQKAPQTGCPAPQFEPTRPLEGDCRLEFEWLMANPEQLIRVTPSSMEAGGPSGPAIHPVLDGIDRSWANLLPREGASQPTAVVFIGHFDDPRAVRCRPEGRQACLDRFVVDWVAWVNGVAIAG